MQWTDEYAEKLLVYLVPNFAEDTLTNACQITAVSLM